MAAIQPYSLADFLGPSEMQAVRSGGGQLQQQRPGFHATSVNELLFSNSYRSGDSDDTAEDEHRPLGTSAVTLSSSSLTRVPAALKTLGVPSQFSPSSSTTPASTPSKRRGGGANAAATGINQTPVSPGTSGGWRAGRRDQKAADSAGTRFVAVNPSGPDRTGDQEDYFGAAAAPAWPETAESAAVQLEARAQLFYRKLQCAAKRELEIGQVKSPTQNGCVVGREKAPLQYARVELREPGIATKRLGEVNRKLYDEMIDRVAPAAAKIQSANRSFDAMRAHHVALYSSSSSPAATLASSRSGVMSPHVSLLEYNPYFPRNAAAEDRRRNATGNDGSSAVALLPAPSAVAHPLVVAIPAVDVHGHTTLLSPRKGDVGTLALAVPPATERSAVDRPSTRTEQDWRYLATPPAPLNACLRLAADGAQQRSDSSTLTPELSRDHRQVLLHACRFTVDQPMRGGGSLFFTAPYHFEQVVGAPIHYVDKMLRSMHASIDSWDRLDRSTREYHIVCRLLEVLLHQQHWKLPNLRLPSGTASTSKLRVQDVYRALTGQ